MKKALLTFVLFGLVGSLYAQYDDALNESTRRFVEYAERYSSPSHFLPDDYNGTPYSNEVFLPGTIYENNKAIVSDYFFRLNAVEDEMEVKQNLEDPDTEIKVLTKSPDIYVKIMNDLFVYHASEATPEENGYFQVLVVGNNYNLYKKLYKKFYPAKKARNSFEKDILASYKDKPIYYLVNQDGNFYSVPSSKNKRLKTFVSKKTEINKFIKHAKMDITKESDFIKVFKYFDSFKDASL